MGRKTGLVSSTGACCKMPPLSLSRSRPLTIHNLNLAHKQSSTCYQYSESHDASHEECPSMVAGKNIVLNRSPGSASRHTILRHENSCRAAEALRGRSGEVLELNDGLGRRFLDGKARTAGGELHTMQGVVAARREAGRINLRRYGVPADRPAKDQCQISDATSARCRG